MAGPRASILVLSALLVVSGGACQRAERTAAGGPASEVPALLKRLTQELMDAVAPGKAEVWQRYLLDDALYLDENGVVYDKATLLKELTPLPAGLVGRMVVDKFQVKVHGDTAVAAAEIQEYLDYHGQDLRTRFRFVDTWLKTPDGWRLAARHSAAVLKDPPSVSLSSEDVVSWTLIDSPLAELIPRREVGAAGEPGWSRCIRFLENGNALAVVIA